MPVRLALLALAAGALVAYWWVRSDVARSNHVMDVLI